MAVTIDSFEEHKDVSDHFLKSFVSKQPIIAHLGADLEFQQYVGVSNLSNKGTHLNHKDFV
jgi:hypothetical protein